MQNQTPSGVLVRELTNVALTPGAAEHLPPAEYPEAIRNVYANAWTASDVAHLGESAAYLQQLGYIDLAAALNNRAAMMSAAVGASRPFFGFRRAPRFVFKRSLALQLRRNPLLVRRIKQKLRANPLLVRKLRAGLQRRKLAARIRKNPALALKLRKVAFRMRRDPAFAMRIRQRFVRGLV
jgi:hypothetical protein